MFDRIGRQLFWRSYFKEELKFISSYRLCYPEFSWKGLSSSKRFDEISSYWLEHGQRLKRTPEEALVQAISEFSKWYVSENAKNRPALKNFDSDAITKLENDYSRLRELLLDLIWKANPSLSSAACAELLPRWMKAEKLVWDNT